MHSPFFVCDLASTIDSQSLRFLQLKKHALNVAGANSALELKHRGNKVDDRLFRTWLRLQKSRQDVLWRVTGGANAAR